MHAIRVEAQWSKHTGGMLAIWPGCVLKLAQQTKLAQNKWQIIMYNAQSSSSSKEVNNLLHTSWNHGI